MEHLILDSISTLGDLLSDVITALPHQSNLKDAKTGKYLIANWPTAEHFRLTPEGIENLTVHELVLHKSQFKDNLHPRHCDLIEKLDKQVCHRKATAYSEKNTVFDKAGFLHTLSITKAPILSHTHKQVVAIMTYSVDLTYQCDLLSLFRLYQHHYPEKQAIQYFLRYLKIDSYFSPLPTYRETMVLLAMLLDTSHKAAARALTITPKTVDVHLNHLRAKLKTAPLQEILILMRASSREFPNN